MADFKLKRFAASLAFAAAIAAGDAFACPYPFQTYEGTKGNLLSACVNRSAEASNTEDGRVEFGACGPNDKTASTDSETDWLAEDGPLPGLASLDGDGEAAPLIVT